MATAVLGLSAAYAESNVRVDMDDSPKRKPMSKSKFKRLKARASGRHATLREDHHVPKKKSSSLKKMLGSKGRK